jgi:hypothetical protein
MDFDFFNECPRCGSRTLERLSSHTHCIECLWSPDFDSRDSGTFGFTKATLDELKNEDRADTNEAEVGLSHVA